MKKLILLLLLVSITSLGFGEYSNPLSLGQDEDGWTVFTPSAGARLFYIAEGGSADPTDDYYSPAQIGGDPFEPDGNMDDPYDTYAHVIASGYVRDGYGDYILFKRGETFTATITEHSGASDSDFFVVGAYGSSDALPIINPATASTVPLDMYTEAGFQRFAVINLDFYHTLRDPESGDYVDTTGNNGFGIFGNGSITIRQVLVEGCKFRFFIQNNIQGYAGATVGECVLRRNLILDNYPASSGSDSHGLYSSDVNGILLEENIFDHNGWYDKYSGSIGQASQDGRDHHIYFEDSANVTIKKNIFTRASSLSLKVISNDTGSTSNIYIDDNLFIDGEFAIQVADESGNYRFEDIDVVDNILTNIDRDPPTERDIGWALFATEWNGGSISGNLVMNWENAAVSNTKFLEIGQMKDVTIDGNVVYNVNPNGNSDGTSIMPISSGFSGSGMVFQNNIFQDMDNSIYLIDFGEAGDEEAWTFTNNTYYSGVEHFESGVSTYDFDGWVTLTGETGSFERYSFPAAGRDIETYMASLGQTQTILAFINKCRDQERYTWDTDYTTESVNAWIRAGYFGSPPGGGATKLVMILAQVFGFWPTFIDSVILLSWNGVGILMTLWFGAKMINRI